MALFKIFKGNQTDNLLNSSATGYRTPTDGYAYYDTSTKLFYIDADYRSNPDPENPVITRQPINAARAGVAGNALNGIFYGTCDTAATTKAKVATLIDDIGFTLAEGIIVLIKFTNAAASSTMTLNVNGTGAKTLYQYGTTLMSSGTTTSGWIAGAVVPFVYTSTAWQRFYWSNTTYNSMTDAEITAGTGTTARIITPARLKTAIQTYNTDTLVKQTVKSDNVNYKLLMGANSSPTSGTAYEAVYDTNITVNPSTDTITATTFAGNATTATTANKVANKLIFGDIVNPAHSYDGSEQIIIPIYDGTIS